MTALAKKPLEVAAEPSGLARVYLVPAEAVADFYDLLGQAKRALTVNGDGNGDMEVGALRRLAEHVEETFNDSTIVKARFK